MTKEKTMRKLRQKILFEDVMDWTIDKHSGMTHCAIEAFHLFYNGSTTGMESCFDDLPDSFYEQPPVGSFGKAWNGPEPLHPQRGYLCKVDCGKYWLYSRDMPFEHFTPGLPQDVDEFGMPLEKNDA